jgi:hypothetical protein
LFFYNSKCINKSRVLSYVHKRLKLTFDILDYACKS